MFSETDSEEELSLYWHVVRKAAKPVITFSVLKQRKKQNRKNPTKQKKPPNITTANLRKIIVNWIWFEDQRGHSKFSLNSEGAVLKHVEIQAKSEKKQ